MSYEDEIKTHPRRKYLGRVPFRITPDMKEKIAKLARLHLKDKQMRELMGISHTTWYKKVKTNPEILEIIARNKIITIEGMSNTVIEAGLAGNVKAAAYFLDRKGGWGKKEKKIRLIHETDKKKTDEVLSNDPIEAAKQYKKIMQGD